MRAILAASPRHSSWRCGEVSPRGVHLAVPQRDAGTHFVFRPTCRVIHEQIPPYEELASALDSTGPEQFRNFGQYCSGEHTAAWEHEDTKALFHMNCSRVNELLVVVDMCPVPSSRCRHGHRLGVVARFRLLACTSIPPCRPTFRVCGELVPAWSSSSTVPALSGRPPPPPAPGRDRRSPVCLRRGGGVRPRPQDDRAGERGRRARGRTTPGGHEFFFLFRRLLHILK